MKILIGIPSCSAHAIYELAQLETWIEDVPKSIDVAFVRGQNASIFSAFASVRHLHFGEDDYKPEQGLQKYPTLPAKTKLLCKYALRQGYDYLFKTDTDTLVNPENLLFSDFEEHDYTGGYNKEESGEFCSGGAGYWLSRKAMKVIVNTTVEHWSEDVFVALALLEKGIYPHFDPNYRWKPGEVVDKTMISLHLRSARNEKTYNPIWMHETYAQMKAL